MKARLTDKASRVLKMMIGLRSARVAAAMAAYGFTDADLAEGWHLLQSVSRVKLDAGAAPANADTIAKLDAWENQWFPISSATLERRFPAVHAQIFKNLSQTSGPAVTVSVQTFLDRVDQMSDGNGSYGAEGKAARAVLEVRGLSSAVLGEARALLESMGKVSTPTEATTLEQDEEQLAKAEASLWAWYLEWSQIARIAIRQRGLLRQMGFGSSRSRSADESADESDGDDGHDDLPEPPPPPAASPVP